MIDVLYGLAIGSQMYPATYTKPDLVATVSELSKFSHNRGVAHWDGLERVLRYLDGTTSERLLYKRGGVGLLRL